MFFWAKTRTSSAVISFPTFTGSLNPLGSSDPLEVSIIATLITTLLLTVLQFPENMDFLLSAVIVLRVTLEFFFSPVSFRKDTHFKDFVFVVAFSVSFSFLVLFFLDSQLMQNWSLISIFDPREE